MTRLSTQTLKSEDNSRDTPHHKDVDLQVRDSQRSSSTRCLVRKLTLIHLCRSLKVWREKRISRLKRERRTYQSQISTFHRSHQPSANLNPSIMSTVDPSNSKRSTQMATRLAKCLKASLKKRRQASTPPRFRAHPRHQRWAIHQCKAKSLSN